ncbi:unnamed protein product [Acanthoscelides obtectus]|uniref:Integrase catalytic domain-containing protein n=1 Tax=Acanthoscelides obtectus TaxID=200917 RepID=A0A9P0PL46_ACAOB|nr:unnamed protein product [Acanthoscelides obtectus]CAK1649514.1 Retrovirus-related Pol polyprotein from transposon 17.6 [Acanthoscelides obtectus]
MPNCKERGRSGVTSGNDHFSRYAQAYQTMSRNHVDILSKMKHFFSHHGFPKSLHADYGELRSEVIKDYCKAHEIHLHLGSTSNPSSIAPIERLHGTIGEKFRILRQTRKTDTTTDLMTDVILNYNQSVHSTTKHTPFDLLYGSTEDPYSSHLKQILEKDKINEQIAHDSYNQLKKQTNKINEKRVSKIPVLKSPIYIKIPIRQTKDKPKYQKHTIFKQQGNQILIKDRKHMLRRIKPQRKNPLQSSTSLMATNSSATDEPSAQSTSEHEGHKENEKGNELSRQEAVNPLIGPDPLCGVTRTRTKQSIRNWTKRRSLEWWKSQLGLRQVNFSYKAYLEKRKNSVMNQVREKVKQQQEILELMD